MDEYEPDEGLDEGKSPEDRKVSKKDQLTYRTSIQKRVDRCLDSIDRDYFPRRVKAFRASIYWTVPGLPFKDRIDVKEKELRKSYEKEIEPYKNNRSIWHDPLMKQYFNFRPHYNYHYRLFEFLMMLLAEHDALIRAKEWVEEGAD